MPGAAASAWIADVVPGELDPVLHPARRARRRRRRRHPGRGPGHRPDQPDRHVRRRPAGRPHRRSRGRRRGPRRRRTAPLHRRRPGDGAGGDRCRRRDHRAGGARRPSRARGRDDRDRADRQRHAARPPVAGIVERSIPGSGGEAMLVGWKDAVTPRRRGCRRLRDPLRARRARLGARRPARGRPATYALDYVTLDRINGAIDDALGRIFGLFDALAAVAVLIAALGIVNTLTMNVIERVREIGILRAAGMTRRQVWRSVVVEAGILGLAGADPRRGPRPGRGRADGRPRGRAARRGHRDPVAGRRAQPVARASRWPCSRPPIRPGWPAGSPSSGRSGSNSRMLDSARSVTVQVALAAEPG